MPWFDLWKAKLDSLSNYELAAFIAVPIVEFLIIAIWLRVIWPLKNPPKSQDAPDLADLLAGVERFFRKGNNVVVAKSFTTKSGHKLSKGQHGHVVGDKDTSSDLADTRDVYVTFDGESGKVLVTRLEGRNLEISAKELSHLAGPASETTALMEGKKSAKVMGAGDTGGYYDTPWTETFDLQFLVLMIVFIIALFVITHFIPVTDDLQGFLLHQLPKVGVMMTVSFLGGIVARQYCDVDERGYVTTSADSWFKVNYTRKIQHFAAYLIPLVMANPEVEANTPIQKMIVTAWADWFTLIGFLVLIEPIREFPGFIGKFFMLQFNSLDRPEDRPHTLDWIILGNILPGLVCILFFNWLYNLLGLSIGLTMIFVLVAGVGDGLAEPVGVYLGRHKYRVSGCGDGGVKYTRSLEGSMCVYYTTLLFVCQYIHAFPNMLSFWIAIVVMPPVMTLSEAYAPHTLDTPVLMGLGGSALLAIVMLADPDKRHSIGIPY